MNISIFFYLCTSQREIWKGDGRGGGGGGFVPGESHTGWDLGPSAAVLAPGWMSPPAREHKELLRDYKSLCTRAVKANDEQDTKTKNPTVNSEKPGAKAGYRTWTLHTAPPRGWADLLNHSSGPPLGPAVTFTPLKGPAWPPQWARTLVACFHSFLLQQVPQ